jgi:mRNA interferase RelE/StbE
MKILIAKRAEKYLKKIPKIDQIAIVRKIRLLTSPSSNEEKLKGLKNIYRVRIGDYRIVFRKTKEEIFIVLIGHRKEIYQLINRLFQ